MRQRDPRPRWTDGIPDHIAAFCGFLFTTIHGIAATFVITQCVVPLFGGIIKGATSVYIHAPFMFLMLFLIWKLTRRRPWAWWMTLVIVVLGATSTTMTAFNRLRDDFYGSIMAITLVTGLGLTAHLVYIRRYYRRTGRSLERPPEE